MAQVPDATLRAWLAYHGESRAQSAEQKALFWAWEAVAELVFTDPEAEWEAVLSLVELAENDWHLANIAAGPLEDLLTHHPATFRDRLDEQARRNPRFRRCLTGVWLNEESPLRDVVRKYAATITEPL